ncbi:MAG: glycerophosphodiester phosphodiesterase family protein [Deltaproteobacteria bacterium]|nr:glycerophosphodiester phosphodiesterase family protein [Deltaproteobacteria bacterium]
MLLYLDRVHSKRYIEGTCPEWREAGGLDLDLSSEVSNAEGMSNVSMKAVMGGAISSSSFWVIALFGALALIAGCDHESGRGQDLASPHGDGQPRDAWACDGRIADGARVDGALADRGVDVSNDAGGKAELGADAPSPMDARQGDSGPIWPTYRTSLGVCWMDPTCRRALIVSHGGDWDLSIPYGSRTAFERAYTKGTDVIKCDLRMTKDGVAVAAHSSPIEYWESLDCGGKKIEDMTAAQVTGCHFLLSKDTFMRVDDVLAWARGKVIVMLTVKESRDFAGGISTVIAAGAQDRVFFEIDTKDFQDTIPSAVGWKQVRYLVQINKTTDLDLMLNQVKDPTHAFMFELDPTYSNATAKQVADFITTRLRPAGIRAFAATAANPVTATVQNHAALFSQGFDVVMSYNLANGLVARTQANQARGISPP